jgi:hypothetical protein
LELFVVAYIMEVFSFRKQGSVPLLVNPSQTAVKKKKKKKKKQKKPEGAGAV